MRIGFISLLLFLTACSSNKSCNQLALESAGQAMSNVQYNLSRYNDYQALINCSSANGCPIMPFKSGYDTGATSGQYSQTGYRGLSPREAYDTVLKTCNSY